MYQWIREERGEEIFLLDGRLRGFVRHKGLFGSAPENRSLNHAEVSLRGLQGSSEAFQPRRARENGSRKTETIVHELRAADSMEKTQESFGKLHQQGREQVLLHDRRLRIFVWLQRGFELAQLSSSSIEGEMPLQKLHIVHETLFSEHSHTTGSRQSQKILPELRKTHELGKFEAASRELRH